MRPEACRSSGLPNLPRNRTSTRSTIRSSQARRGSISITRCRSGVPPYFSTKILHTEGASDLVVPNGVTVKGDDIELAGQEPKTQASIYRIKNASFKVEVDGTGSLSEASSAASSDDDSGQPTIQEVKPRIYDRLYWILGMAFAILGLGSAILYRSKA